MFIALDGPDGTGKTTLARALAGALKNAIYTAEPTDSATGKKIRELLKAPDSGGREILALFLQDRREHIEAQILPALQGGATVVCDRYKYSTVCYQHIQGEPLKKLVEANRGFLAPDVTFILYTGDVKLLLTRIGMRGQVQDGFESEQTLKKVCRLYRRMPLLFAQERFIFVPAELPTDAAVRLCLEVVERIAPPLA